MQIYQYVGIDESNASKKTGYGKRVVAKSYNTEKTNTWFYYETFNNINNEKVIEFSFKDIPLGSYFICEYGKKPYIKIIQESEIPAILEKKKEEARLQREAYEKERDAKIATGKFRYFYTEFRDGQAENIIEFITDKYEDFWPVFVTLLNSDKGGRSKSQIRNFKLEQVQKEERYAKFMDLAQPGDKLEWYSWNGGVLAYSAGPCITRNGEIIASQSWIVS